MSFHLTPKPCVELGQHLAAIRFNDHAVRQIGHERVGGQTTICTGACLRGDPTGNTHPIEAAERVRDHQEATTVGETLRHQHWFPLIQPRAGFAERCARAVDHASAGHGDSANRDSETCVGVYLGVTDYFLRAWSTGSDDNPTA